MPWVKLDDHFDEHPKLAEVGPFGLSLWVSGLAYCNRNLTDGYIPLSVARTLIDLTNFQYEGYPPGSQGDVGWTTRLVIEDLVTAKLWDEVPGGYRVHDFDDYQPTKAEVEAERKQKAAAGKAGGLARGKQNPKQNPSGVLSSSLSETEAEPQAEPKPVPVPGPVPLASKEAGSLNARAMSDDGATTDPLEAWMQVTASWPTPRVVPWINQLAEEYGAETFVSSLAAEAIENPDRSTLLSRTRDRMAAESHRASKAAEAARKASDAKRQAEIETMPEEQRKANLERLREEMAKKGLLRSMPGGKTA